MPGQLTGKASHLLRGERTCTIEPTRALAAETFRLERKLKAGG